VLYVVLSVNIKAVQHVGNLCNCVCSIEILMLGLCCCTVQSNDIREKYLLKAAAFVTTSRDSWMRKHHRVANLRQKVELYIECCMGLAAFC